MPIAGRKPSGRLGVSNNYHPPIHDWVEVADVPFGGGPDLPARRRDGKPWPKWAVARWDQWRSMPHAALWHEPEWAYALDALEVLVLGFVKGSAMMLVEARHREHQLGTTTDSRRDLRIPYVPAGGSGGEWVVADRLQGRAMTGAANSYDRDGTFWRDLGAAHRADAAAQRWPAVSRRNRPSS